MKKNFSYRMSIAIFTLPTLILFTFVVCYPILQTVVKSMTEWDGIGSAKFTGLANYFRLFQDADFYRASNNGLIFSAVLVIFQIGLGTVLALILANKNVPGRRFFRTTYFMPVVLSITVGCMLWLAVYNSDNGLLNKILKGLGIAYQQKWLSDMNTAIYAVIFVNAWQYMGIHMILIFAAVKSIPEHYFEAATIDGASTIKAHLHITLPMLAETYKFCLVLAIVGGLKAFENMFIMTSGGPGTATYTLTYLMYSSAFRAQEYGYACSVATVLVIQCLVFTILVNKFVARDRIVY